VSRTTVWLVLFLLIGVGGLIMTKATTHQQSQSEPSRPEPPAVIAENIVDTLSKADKLEVAYVKEALEDRPAPFVDEAPLPGPPAPIADVKIQSRHWHEAKAKADTKQISSRQPSKKVATKKPKTDVARAKPLNQVRECPQPTGFNSLLTALNLKARCES
jgi:hypothetical protein